MATSPCLTQRKHYGKTRKDERKHRVASGQWSHKARTQDPQDTTEIPTTQSSRTGQTEKPETGSQEVPEEQIGKIAGEHMIDDILKLDPKLFKKAGYTPAKMKTIKTLMMIVSHTPDLMDKWGEYADNSDPWQDFNQYLFEACEWCYRNQDMIRKRGSN